MAGVHMCVCVCLSVCTSRRRMQDDSFWEEFTRDTRENASFYQNYSSDYRTRLFVDIILMFNSLLMFFGFVYVLRAVV